MPRRFHCVFLEDPSSIRRDTPTPGACTSRGSAYISSGVRLRGVAAAGRSSIAQRRNARGGWPLRNCVMEKKKAPQGKPVEPFVN